MPQLSNASPAKVAARQQTYDVIANGRREEPASGSGGGGSSPAAGHRRSRSRRPSFRKALAHLSDSAGARFSVPSESCRQEHATPPSPGGTLQRKSWTHMRKSSSASIAAAELPGPSYHYQDPEARAQLKLCLASPHKFDEALRFGFPTSPALAGGHFDVSDSLVDSNLRRHQANSSHPRLPPIVKGDELLTGIDTLDFFNDSDSSDADSAAADDDGDGDDKYAERHSGTGVDEEDDDGDGDDDANVSDVEADSPMTPSSMQYLPGIPGYGTAASNDSAMTALPSFPKRQDSSNWQTSWPGQREMTIRMTLTRPELRERDDEQRMASPITVGYATRPFRVNSSTARPSMDFAPRDEDEPGKVRRMLRRMTAGRK